MMMVAMIVFSHSHSGARFERWPRNRCIFL
jgi:hypothetical protein